MVDRTLAGSLGLKGGWAPGEDGWDVDMGANLLWLSVLVQGRFIDVVGAEPGSPVEGDVYILASAHPTHPNELAVYDGGAWHYRAALVGWRLFNTTLGVFQQWNSTAWAMDASGLTAEDVRDIMGSALVNGTNVTITPNDGADTITINATGGGSTDEQIQDMLSTFLQQGTNVTLTYDDTGNHLTIASTASGTGAGSSSGIWTPTMNFGGAAVGLTYLKQDGFYVRTGKLVTIWFDLQINAKGTSTGNVFVGGLPFNASTTLYQVGSPMWSSNAGSLGALPWFGAASGASSAKMFGLRANAASLAALASTSVSAATELVGTYSYITDDA